MSDGLATPPNAFQRLMLQWERLAPYNAGQYATLAVGLDPTRVTQAWRATSVRLGLQQVGQHPDVAVDLVTGALEQHATDEMNRRFAPGESPFRPFIAVEGGQTSVGLIYRHVVADSASVRLVMGTWFDNLRPRGGLRTALPIRLAQERSFSLFDARRRWSIIREIASEMSRASRAKRVRRLPPSDPSGKVTWRRVALPDGTVGRLLAYARRHGVKVNDLFVAAAAMACDEGMPHEGVATRRDLGVGTIADVRPLDRPAQDHFGLSLGFLQTFWRRQDLSSWPTVLRVAATQSRIARARHLAAASALRLWAAAQVGASLDDPKLATFYRKRCPLSAGISNVNLSREWPGRHHPSPLLSYTRISPLGPMLPLVITPTTLGDTLHLGVTYRPAVIDDARCDAILDAFIARLNTFE